MKLSPASSSFLYHRDRANNESVDRQEPTIHYVRNPPTWGRARPARVNQGDVRLKPDWRVVVTT